MNNIIGNKKFFLKSMMYNLYLTKTNKKCSVLEICNIYFPNKPCLTCTYPLKNECKQDDTLIIGKFKLCNPYDPHWPCNTCNKYKIPKHDLPCNAF